jgi:membrane protein DedA with SNARE-associated domain
MDEMISNYIIHYGFIAIFVIVLLHELGMPGLPNEMVLFYFGFVCYKYHLDLITVICLVILADITGSLILYCVFFYGSFWMKKIKVKWLKLPERKIQSIKEKILLHDGRNIFFAKLTPFVRTYIPVVAGMIQIKPYLFGRIVLFTAVIRSFCWLIAGWYIHV